MRGVNTCVLTVRRSNLDAQPCRRSPHPGNRRVPRILEVDIACRATKAVTRRHLGCIGDPSEAADTDIVQAATSEITDRHTVHQ